MIVIIKIITKKSMGRQIARIRVSGYIVIVYIRLKITLRGIALSLLISNEVRQFPNDRRDVS